MIRLINTTTDELGDYVTTQLATFFPDKQPRDELRRILGRDLDQALERLRVNISCVRMWKVDEFDYLHSEQYGIFLYYLANTVWRNQQDRTTCTKLFFLNKTLNSFNCFYDVELPDKFFVGHSLGIVLARATYSNYLVLYQNSTVGKNHGVAPVLEEGVVMYPNTAIIGRAQVRAGTVISQGTSVINRDTPGNCVVFRGQGADLLFKPATRDILGDIFRT
jgi:serine O-acetyltransferase